MRKLLLLLLVAFGTSFALNTQAAAIQFGAIDLQSDILPQGIPARPYVNPSGAGNTKTIDKSMQNCWSLDTRMPCFSMASLSGLWTLPLEYP